MTSKLLPEKIHIFYEAKVPIFFLKLVVPLNRAGWVSGLNKDLQVRGVGVVVGQNLLIVHLVQTHLWR